MRGLWISLKLHAAVLHNFGGPVKLNIPDGDLSIQYWLKMAGSHGVPS